MPEGLHDDDVLLWSEQQASLLRRLAAGERVNADIDWANVIEEVGDVGRSELNACQSLLLQAIVHLLKLQAFPDHEAAAHWRGEAIGHLTRTRRRFTPFMRSRIDLAGLYNDAVDEVSAACPGVTDWPAACPYALDDLLQRTALVAKLLERTGRGAV